MNLDFLLIKKVNIDPLKIKHNKDVCMEVTPLVFLFRCDFDFPLSVLL